MASENHHELTTQMYFDGDVLNSADRILNGMTQKEQDSVIASFTEDENKVLNGTFNIAIVAK